MLRLTWILLSFLTTYHWRMLVKQSEVRCPFELENIGLTALGICTELIGPSVGVT